MKEKVKNEKLSIYLINDHNLNDDDIINTKEINTDKSRCIEISTGQKLKLYVKKTSINTPKWTNLFTRGGHVDKGIFDETSFVGAVLIIRHDQDTFVFSFGGGYHLIKPEVIKRNFGLRTTLTSINPTKLKSLDRGSYESNPLNSRTQSMKEVSLSNLNLDREREILSTVTGASKYKELGNNVTGKDSLTLTVPLNLEGIPELLRNIKERYDDKLPEEFEWVDNINDVKDLNLIRQLDQEVEKAFANGEYSTFWLGEPDIVDWENQIGYSFDLRPRTPRYTSLNINDYIAHLGDTIPTVEIMKKNVVHINDADYKSKNSWPVYKCLYAEISHKNETYVLRSGVWYKICSEFVKSTDDSINGLLDSYNLNLPIYKHDKELDYNTKVSQDMGMHLMDQKNIQIGGVFDKVEHCDLINNGNDFIHVKMYRSSSTLSHLFSQGIVSAEAFVGSAEYRNKLNEKLSEDIKITNPEKRPDTQNFRIVYAIATSKSLPSELPFFSKITLRNSLKRLKAFGYQVSLTKIDICDNFLKTKKYKPKKKEG